MKKRITLIAMIASLTASCTAMPTYAFTDESTVVATEGTAEYVTVDGAVTTEASDAPSTETGTQSPVIDRSVSVTPTPAASTTEEQPSAPLTPSGNMTLVDDVTVSSGTKQFLTLTTREGNFYYLIIDRDKDGRENVHFLNQVDERDLISIMNEDEAKELEETLTREAEERAAAEEAEKAVKEAQKAQAEETPEEEPPAPVEKEKMITIAGYEFSQKFVASIATLGFFLIGLIIAFIVLTKKKHKEDRKEDPDAGYDDGDEIVIPEATREEVESGEFGE